MRSTTHAKRPIQYLTGNPLRLAAILLGLQGFAVPAEHLFVMADDGLAKTIDDATSPTSSKREYPGQVGQLAASQEQTASQERPPAAKKQRHANADKTENRDSRGRASSATRRPAAPVPTPNGKVITMPKGVVPPMPEISDSPAIEDAIRKELESPYSVGPIGNPMVGDVIDVIRGRQSVLTGSLLDELSRRPDRLLNDSSVATESVSERQTLRRASQLDQKAHAAENLLKAARLLAKVSPEDAHRRNLIRQMRIEAARLLGDFGVGHHGFANEDAGGRNSAMPHDNTGVVSPTSRPASDQ
ncbi:hypothetical protein U8335_00095 [Roseiconus lacunae]|uniref:hypothetical protein n=1 Tax=Roseiconus lacunae TaxID=2605694 RepID=UPI003091066E|nr:hypothetical protein U8335_00095 [Stieleria sp. HD01]